MASRLHVEPGLLRNLTFAVTVAGLLVGFAAVALQHPQIAALSWAATTLAALVPLSVSVIRTLSRGKPGVDIIALLAMAGALILGQYLAGAVIALMLAGGQVLEDFAGARARRELSALVERTPRTAHRYEGDVLARVPVEEVRPGDLLLVKPGEMAPVDGIVEEPSAVLDESALTGEAGPVLRMRGDRIRSGAVNSARAPLKMRATAAAAESTYAGIVRLVEEAQAGKARLIRLADRFAMLFLPVAVGTALGAWAISGEPVRALAVLVVATPCPLILAAPIAIVAGISRAARRGIIVKGGAALETLAKAEILVLDKTGTVTAGSPVLTAVESFGKWEPQDVLRMAASLDQVSPHVLASAILNAAAERGLKLSFPAEVEEQLGAGIRGRVDGHGVALGKAEWVLDGGPFPPSLRRLQRRTRFEGSSCVVVSLDGEAAGALVLEDPIRPDAPSTLRSMRRTGFRRIVILTGDHADVARSVGVALGADRVFAERSPAEKVDAVRAESLGGVTIMVGDGINDAPALAAAHVGVALGAHGATAASEAADVVLLLDRIDRLADAVHIARRSHRIAMQSIVAGMGLSFLAMGFAAAGYLPPVGGAVLQEIIDVLVIFSALRNLRGPAIRKPATRLQAELGRQFRSEHKEILSGMRRIRALADGLDRLSPAEVRAESREVYDFLTNRVLPHDAAEDESIYPLVTDLVGAADASATMSRAHMEIAHLVRLFGSVLEDMDPEGPDADDLRELRRILYGLDAILRLHFAQEDQYLALVEESGPDTPSPVEV